MERTLAQKTDIEMSLIEKKIEKLVSAIYIVTSYMDQTDVLITPLRKSALCLFDTKRMDSMRHDYSKLSQALSTVAAHVRIGQLSGSISLMNSDLLLHAILHLQQEIESRVSSEQFVLPETFFEEIYKDTLPLENNSHVSLSSSVPEKLFPSIVKDISHFVPKTDQKSFSEISTKKISSQHHTEGFSQKISTGKKLDLALRLNRRNTLLRLIREKGSVSIKECMSVISDCGEKTIQRELNQLLEQKVLKKTGDKRWSRYSLA